MRERVCSLVTASTAPPSSTSSARPPSSSPASRLASTSTRTLYWQRVDEPAIASPFGRGRAHRGRGWRKGVARQRRAHPHPAPLPEGEGTPLVGMHATVDPIVVETVKATLASAEAEVDAAIHR